MNMTRISIAFLAAFACGVASAQPADVNQYRILRPDDRGIFRAAAAQAAGSVMDDLLSEVPDVRQRAQRMLSAERRLLISRLVEIVETTNGEGEFTSSRAVSAQLLGEWRAVEAVPALARHMKYKVLVAVDIAKFFYFEEYPCASAIYEMGPSALKPFFEAIAQREEPLDEEELKVAANVVYGIFEHNKGESLEAVRRAEELHGNNEQLHRIHQYIEEFLGLDKTLERQRAAPKK